MSILTHCDFDYNYTFVHSDDPWQLNHSDYHNPDWLKATQIKATSFPMRHNVRVLGIIANIDLAIISSRILSSCIYSIVFDHFFLRVVTLSPNYLPTMFLP